MKDNDLIERSVCPLCGGSECRVLFPVDSEIFLGSNPTIDHTRLQASGLLELPAIQIVECLKCQLRFCGQMLSPKWNSVFWDEVYIPDQSQSKILKTAKRLSNIRIWSTLAQILLNGRIADAEVVNVLDLGCGWGDFLMTARSPGIRTIGIEISPPKIAFAQAQGLEVYKSIEDVPGNLKFHAFHCDQVLEHVQRPADMLRKLEPLLHAEFVGYIGVPEYSDRRIADLSSNIGKGIDVRDKDLITWDHLNYFSIASFNQLLGTCDFSPIELPSGTSLGTLTSTAAYVRRTSMLVHRTHNSQRLAMETPPRFVPQLLQKLRNMRCLRFENI